MTDAAPIHDEALEQPRTVGEILKAERRRQGRSIMDVQAATHIMVKHLEALEDGRWNELPSPAYVKGYVQNYAKYLDIPVEPILERYRHEGGHPASRPSRFKIPEPVIPAREQMHSISPKAWVIVLAVAVLALSVFGIAQLFARREKPTPLPIESSQTGGAANAKGTPGLSQKETEALSRPAGKAFRVTVSVKSGSMSWVRVVVDGLEAYNANMPGGESKTWRVTDEAQVQVGKPSKVTVKRDGQEQELKVVRGEGQLTLTARK